MNNYNRAPIVVFAYNRYLDFKSLINSLLKNKECLESDIYIFIDGKKNENDTEAIENIYSFAKRINGFNKVTITKSNTNLGLANSIISGVTKVINEYGRVIVFEDDLEVSNSILRYFNSALDIYESDKKVFSIAGYCPNIKTNNDDVFFYPRIESWGWASWKDRWNTVDWEVLDYNAFINNKYEVNSFNRGGNDLSKMLESQQSGLVNSWAIRFCYASYKNNSFTAYPPKSLVSNNGCNSSGTNFKELTNRYDVEIVNDYIPNLVPFEGKLENYNRMLNFYNCKRPIDYYNKVVNKIRKKVKGLLQ